MSSHILPQEAEQQTYGMSLEQAIVEFVRIQDRYAELAEEKKRILEVLIPAANEAKGQTKTARLSNHNRSVVLKADFSSNVTCNTDALNQVKEIVGDDVFDDLFKTEYTPKLKTLKPFMAERSTDERIETAKLEIAKAIKTSPTPPRFTVEKS